MGAYKLLINGQMVDGELSMDVVNPPLKRNWQTASSI